MPSNNEYKRYFIILQEDDKGYEMSTGKTPTGYVKIEVKNGKVRLNAFIQNVKHEGRIEYRLILVATGKKLAVDIGKIIIDNSGRGELSYELESDNVLKSGMSIGDFTVAAVAAGVSVPLSGYTGRDKLEWKGRYDIVNRQKSQELPRIDKKITIEEIVPEIPAPPKPIIPPEPIAPPQPVIIPQPIQEPETPMEMPPVVEVVPEPEIVIIVQPPIIEEPHVHVPTCPPMAPMEEPCEIEEEKLQWDDIHQYYCEDEDEHEEEHEHCHKEHHEHMLSQYYSTNMYNRLKRILKRLRRYDPFEKDEGYDWYKVGDDIYGINEVTVPYMGYMMPLGYPFISEGCSMMMDRKNYVIGIKYDDKEDDDDKKLIRYLLFGVPSVYSKKNEQYYKSRGFMEYIPHKSKSYGFFIMCLDISKGTLCQMD